MLLTKLEKENKTRNIKGNCTAGKITAFIPFLSENSARIPETTEIGKSHGMNGASKSPKTNPNSIVAFPMSTVDKTTYRTILYTGASAIALKDGLGRSLKSGTMAPPITKVNTAPNAITIKSLYLLLIYNLSFLANPGSKQGTNNCNNGNYLH